MDEIAVLAARLVPALLLLIALAVLARRWAQHGGASGGTAMRVTARTGLSRSAVVAVLAVDDRRFLVGAGDGGVRLLAELSAAAVPDSAAAQPESESPTHETSGMEPATPDGPRTGLLDRLRDMTVRVPVDRPDRASTS